MLLQLLKWVKWANDAKVKPAGNTLATNATFKITDTEFYVAVVTLSTEIDSKFLD